MKKVYVGTKAAPRCSFFADTRLCVDIFCFFFFFLPGWPSTHIKSKLPAQLTHRSLASEKKFTSSHHVFIIIARAGGGE